MLYCVLLWLPLQEVSKLLDSLSIKGFKFLKFDGRGEV